MGILNKTKAVLEEMETKKSESMGAKFFQYEEEINEHKYVFQYPGRRACLRMTDQATNEKNVVSKEQLLDLVLKSIVVMPKVDLDYFDEPEYENDYERVVEIAMDIFSGERNIK